MNQLTRPIVSHFVRRSQHGMAASQFFYRPPKHLLVKIRWNSEEHGHIRGRALRLQLMKHPERELIVRKDMGFGFLHDWVRAFQCSAIDVCRTPENQTGHICERFFPRKIVRYTVMPNADSRRWINSTALRESIPNRPNGCLPFTRLISQPNTPLTIRSR